MAKLIYDGWWAINKAPSDPGALLFFGLELSRDIPMN